MATRETRLPRTSTIESTDFVRIVQQDDSRNIPFSDLAEIINNLSSDSDSMSFVSIVSDLNLVKTSPRVILCDTETTTINVTLPSAAVALDSATASRVYLIKKTNPNVNDVNVLTTGSELIDGATSITLAGSQYPYVEVMTDGSTWHIIGA